MGTRLVPTTVEHYMQASTDLPVWSDRVGTARGVVASKCAWSAVDGDVLLGCAGIMRLWPGLGYAWALLTPAGRQRPLVVTRLVRQGLAEAMQREKYHRVQADAIKKHKEACRWLEVLGFTKEGIMRRYGADGEDFVRYVRFA